ncbi:RsmB/NOP family class I SAM-dependent RNA methyltransferase [Niveibacterium sp.]|uniref:RsmB/NOP family class I SAM-dependent RNA methyltransferase n=1 Tax=Niveibacterium sp. TaxID=2017444 RepID=UPI0035B1F769
MMHITKNRLDEATEVLSEVLRFEHPADAVLSSFFREHKSLGHRDRGVIAETVYAVLRNRRRLEAWCGDRATGRRLLLAALIRVQGISSRQLEEVVSATEQRWLAERQAAAAPQLSYAEQADLPDWLAGRLAEVHGEERALRLAQALNRPAPLDLRVNPLKAKRDEVIAQLRADGIACEAGIYSPLAIRLAEKPSLAKHPLFLDGSIEVQDEGSQLLGFLVAPKRGEMVADFCAGAGGKTLLLGGLMRSTGRLYAFDTAERRLARLKPRVARSGLSNVHTSAIAHENDARLKRLAGKIDRVLVDAPCSGLGTLRRNPDLKWRQSPEAVQELTAKQLSILSGAARLLKKGGRLVYATCSVLPEENDAIVDAFLAANPGFRIVSAQDVLTTQGINLACGERLRLDPLEHGTDGFFAVAMERGE